MTGTLLDPTLLVNEPARWLSVIENTLKIVPRCQLGVDEPPSSHGIYFLYMRGRMIYLGKSSGGSVSKTNSIVSRLGTHWDKVQNRVGLFPELMTYQAVPLDSVYSGLILMLEQFAIEKYRPYLNGTGFGSLPPGHGRRFQGASKFEKMHPPITRSEVWKPTTPVVVRRTPVLSSCYA